MAITLLPRTGLNNWGAPSDPFTRAQVNADHASLEALVAIDGQGTLAARPAPGIRGRWYYTTDTGQTFREDGTAWHELAQQWAPGDTKETFSPTVPAGWLLCDGTSYLRATYAALFAVIGTTYGSADGTHFNVPDCRGRVLLGAGTGPGLSARALGSSGGEETHLLIASEMPSHSHQMPGFQAGHVGGTEMTINTAGLVDVETGLTGGGSAHNNMQPFMAANRLIKV